MDMNSFVAEVKNLGINVVSGTVGVTSIVGGAKGGNELGEPTVEYYIAENDENISSGIDYILSKILLHFAPEITLLEYRSIHHLLITTELFLETEEYGNYTTIKRKSVNLEDLHKELECLLQ